MPGNLLEPFFAIDFWQWSKNKPIHFTKLLQNANCGLGVAFEGWNCVGLSSPKTKNSPCSALEDNFNSGYF
jgi:hypothetical protein